MISISERKAKQLLDFNKKYIHDEELALKIYKLYYKYVRMSHRLLEAENDERAYNGQHHIKVLTNQHDKLYEELMGFLKPYGISIYVPWITPCLGIKDGKTGAITEIVMEPILR